jgi:hypothetical protein
MFSCVAFDRTALSLRPNFRPMTRVGVFCLTSIRKLLSSFSVQGRRLL